MHESRSAGKTIGLVIFGIGALLMIGVGFLSSWWFVPQIRDAGFNNLTIAGGLSFLWSISAPIGAMLAAIGGALYARAEGRLVAILIIGSLAVVAFSMVFNLQEVVPPLFGAVGGLITLFFLGSVWNWAKARSRSSGKERLGSDLSMIGHVFFLFAAWYLCGFLGAPTFTIRPDLMENYGTALSVVSLGSLIAIYLALGWGFTFFGHRTSLRGK